MVKQRVYLDTSVLSAHDDQRWPDRAEQTRLFWAKRGEFEFCTSVVAQREIERTGNAARRRQMLAMLDELIIHPLTSEMDALGHEYVAAGIFSEKVLDDALHVAAAILTGCHVMLSWNYRHLVNRQRRAAITAINVTRGLPTIEIIAPPEL